MTSTRPQPAAETGKTPRAGRTTPFSAPLALALLGLSILAAGCWKRTAEVRQDETTAAARPAWIPRYPGSAPVTLYTSQTEGVSCGTFSFATPDDRARVLDFFVRRLEEAGFTLETTPAGGPDGTIGLITGHGAGDDHRSITVTIDVDKDGTGVVVNYSQSS